MSSFYVFPSGYAYLPDALYAHVYPHLTPENQAIARGLWKRLAAADKAEAEGKGPGQDHWLPPGDRSVLQEQLDGLIAAECPLTGSIMINSVDMPFIPDDEEERLSWEI